MNNWERNAHKNILAVSTSPDFDTALKEWTFTGDVVDYKIRCLSCEMCEHEKLRYHFRLKHETNGHQLYVGSSCILKFGNIRVIDKHGRELTNERMRKQLLESALDERQKETMLSSLRQLWQKQTGSRTFIAQQVEHYKTNGAFYPRALLCLFKYMDKWRIEYDPTLYPVNLRRKGYTDAVLAMNHDDYMLLDKALKKDQRERLRVKRETLSA